MQLTITSLYAGLSAIFLVYLSMQVIKKRREKQIRILTASDEELASICRAQGNFIEYTPLFLFLLFLLENQSWHQASWGEWLLYGLGDLFLVGRILHAYSLIFHEIKTGDVKFRVWGMLITFTTLSLLAALSIIYWFKASFLS